MRQIVLLLILQVGFLVSSVMGNDVFFYIRDQTQALQPADSGFGVLRAVLKVADFEAGNPQQIWHYKSKSGQIVSAHDPQLILNAKLDGGHVFLDLQTESDTVFSFESDDFVYTRPSYKEDCRKAYPGSKIDFDQLTGVFHLAGSLYVQKERGMVGLHSFTYIHYGILDDRGHEAGLPVLGMSTKSLQFKVELAPEPSSRKSIDTPFSGKCLVKVKATGNILSVKGGSPVVVPEESGDSSQIWIFSQDSLLNEKSGLYLTLNKESTGKDVLALTTENPQPLHFEKGYLFFKSSTQTGRVYLEHYAQRGEVLQLNPLAYAHRAEQLWELVPAS